MREIHVEAGVSTLDCKGAAMPSTKIYHPSPEFKNLQIPSGYTFFPSIYLARKPWSHPLTLHPSYRIEVNVVPTLRCLWMLFF